MDKGIFSDLFYMVHSSGDKLFPVRVKNRSSGIAAFRVSPGGMGGNTKEAGMEVSNENEMKRLVLEEGFAVRASTVDRSRTGLYKMGQRSITGIVEK